MGFEGVRGRGVYGAVRRSGQVASVEVPVQDRSATAEVTGGSMVDDHFVFDCVRADFLSQLYTVGDRGGEKVVACESLNRASRGWWTNTVLVVDRY